MLFSVPTPNGCFSTKRAFLRKRALFWKLAFFWDLVHKGVKQQDCGQTIRPRSGRNSPHRAQFRANGRNFKKRTFLAVPLPFEIHESDHFLSKRHSVHENGRIYFRAGKKVQLEDPGPQGKIPRETDNQRDGSEVWCGVKPLYPLGVQVPIPNHSIGGDLNLHRSTIETPNLKQGKMGMGSQKTAGFSLWFHLPGFHLGVSLLFERHLYGHGSKSRTPSEHPNPH